MRLLLARAQPSCAWVRASARCLTRTRALAPGSPAGAYGRCRTRCIRRLLICRPRLLSLALGSLCCTWPLLLALICGARRQKARREKRGLIGAQHPATTSYKSPNRRDHSRPCPGSLAPLSRIQSVPGWRLGQARRKATSQHSHLVRGWRPTSWDGKQQAQGQLGEGHRTARARARC